MLKHNLRKNINKKWETSNQLQKNSKKIIEKNHKIFKKKAFKFGFSLGAGQAYDIECNVQCGTASAKQFIFDNMDENSKLVSRNVIKSI